MSIGQYLAGVVFHFISGREITSILTIKPEQVTPGLTDALMASLTVSNTTSFLLASLIFLAVHEKRELFLVQKKKWEPKKLVIIGTLSAFLFIALLVIAGVFQYLTKAFLESVDLGAISESIHKLDNLQSGLYAIFDSIHTPQSFVLAIIGLAIVPAIGEELLFRGIMQNLLIKSNIKPIVSILLIAFVFSAIHSNVEGFLSRFVVGFVLGLVYYKSGNLVAPIAGHFTFNVVQVIYMYLVNIGFLTEQSQSQDTTSYIAVGLSLLIALFIYWVFAKQTKEYNPGISQESLGKDILN